MYTKTTMNTMFFGSYIQFYKDGNPIAVKDYKGMRFIPQPKKSPIIVTRAQAFRYCKKHFGGYAFNMPELLQELVYTVDERAYGYIEKRFPNMANSEEFIVIRDRDFFEFCGYQKP